MVSPLTNIIGSMAPLVTNHPHPQNTGQSPTHGQVVQAAQAAAERARAIPPTSDAERAIDPRKVVQDPFSPGADSEGSPNFHGRYEEEDEEQEEGAEEKDAPPGGPAGRPRLNRFA